VRTTSPVTDPEEIRRRIRAYMEEKPGSVPNPKTIGTDPDADRDVWKKMLASGEVVRRKVRSKKGRMVTHFFLS